jgi:hypothetical protein
LNKSCLYGGVVIVKIDEEFMFECMK